jgi:DNA-binding response OmpR family regulator
MRILVVDDEPSVCEVLSLFLQEQNHEVECAGSGSEGLERFHERGSDLVITDRTMPGMSGDQMATWIRSANPDVPIVMITGSRDRGEGFAFDACISKPFSRATLIDTVRSVIERRKADSPALCEH